MGRDSRSTFCRTQTAQPKSALRGSNTGSEWFGRDNRAGGKVLGVAFENFHTSRPLLHRGEVHQSHDAGVRLSETNSEFNEIFVQGHQNPILDEGP